MFGKRRGNLTQVQNVDKEFRRESQHYLAVRIQVDGHDATMELKHQGFDVHDGEELVLLATPRELKPMIKRGLLKRNLKEVDSMRGGLADMLD